MITKFVEGEYPVGINHLIQEGFVKELFDAGYETTLINYFGINKVEALRRMYKIS